MQLDANFDPVLVVTGAHLSTAHGNTVNFIKSQGVYKIKEISTNLGSDTRLSMAESYAEGVRGFAKLIDSENPDFIILLGDRYEALAAASAAMMMGTPIAHIHGGEVTEGLIDEPIRHSISKMAALHFVSHENHKRRLVSMGENPSNIHVVGGFGVDLVSKAIFMDDAEFNSLMGEAFPTKFLMFTFHPVTNDPRPADEQVSGALKALGEISDQIGIIFTGSNADPGGLKVQETIRDFISGRLNMIFLENMGSRFYFSAIRRSLGVLGNSSSGLLEAPYLGVPTLNIGNRQRGRLHGDSVVDVGDQHKEVSDGIRSLLNLDFSQLDIKKVQIFGNGGATKNTYQVLREWKPSKFGTKTFYEISS